MGEEFKDHAQEAIWGKRLLRIWEGGAEDQSLEPGKVGQPETWGCEWNVCAVAAPGPWNEVEEVAKSGALKEQARGSWAWVC